MNFLSNHPLLRVFILISFLKARPDVLPASWFLLAVLLVLNLVVGIFSFMTDFDFLQSVLRSVTDLLLTLGFVYLLLFSFGKVARALQTLIAMLGVNVMLNIMALPLLIMLPEPRTAPGLPGALLYMLFFWHFVILGHIYQHTFSVKLPVGLLVAIVYIFATLSVFYSFFPMLTAR